MQSINSSQTEHYFMYILVNLNGVGYIIVDSILGQWYILDILNFGWGVQFKMGAHL